MKPGNNAMEIHYFCLIIWCSLGVRLPFGLCAQVLAQLLLEGQLGGDPRIFGQILSPDRLPRPGAAQPPRLDRLRARSLRHSLVPHHVRPLVVPFLFSFFFVLFFIFCTSEGTSSGSAQVRFGMGYIRAKFNLK